MYIYIYIIHKIHMYVFELSASEIRDEPEIGASLHSYLDDARNDRTGCPRLQPVNGMFTPNNFLGYSCTTWLVIGYSEHYNYNPHIQQWLITISSITIYIYIYIIIIYNIYNTYIII